MSGRGFSVALVGAPNVGKSTLFNRLSRQHRSLVHGLPGMTRDRVEADVEVGETRLRLVDTGGILPGTKELIAREVSRQSHIAAEEADLVLLVVDGRLGVTPVDRELAAELHRSHRPVIVVVNKIDTDKQMADPAEFHALGFEHVMPVSAAHGRGIAAVEELLQQNAPSTPAGPGSDAQREVAVALVGRPNVGKSSILNRLLQDDRVLVSERPGTTRDSVDTLLRAHNRVFRLVDTAGIRRRSRAADEPETLAIRQARRALERAQIALVIMDATVGITSGDLAVAGVALDAGRAVIPVLNKWDLVASRAEEAVRFRLEARRRLRFVPHGRMLTVSAVSGLRVRTLLTEALRAMDDFTAWHPTSVWNRALREAVEARRPPMVRGKPFRFYYAVQTSAEPPRVEIFTNAARDLPEDYRRFLGNRLRRATGMERSPLRIVLRRRPERPGA